MAKITIWDMDYYYATERKNIFNSIAMKVSSYHKQLGDEINFVRTRYDLHRPYDKYYIFKNNTQLPDLIEFLLDTSGKIFWYGDAIPSKRKMKLSNELLGCRPDYLLYPEKNTKFERAEMVYFTNMEGEPLSWIQSWDNTFKRKVTLVLDRYLWKNSNEVIKNILTRLQDKKNVFFFEPIPIQKILDNKDIRDEFLKIKLAKEQTSIKWQPFQVGYLNNNKNIDKTLLALNQMKKCGITADRLQIDWVHELWNTQCLSPTTIFSILQNWCIAARKYKIHLILEEPPSDWKENPKLCPDYLFFRYVKIWAAQGYNCWLEWLTQLFCHSYDTMTILDYWNHPSQWAAAFRICLCKTSEYKTFLKFSVNDSYIVNDVNIPWSKWKDQFKYEI